MAKRRANGEGKLRKRDGRWEGRYTAGNDPATGKPIHKSVLAKTQSEAKEKLKQAIKDAEKLDMSRAKSYTLWYEVYAEPRLREKTKDYYRTTLSARGRKVSAISMARRRCPTCGGLKLPPNRARPAARFPSMSIAAPAPDRRPQTWWWSAPARPWGRRRGAWTWRCRSPRQGPAGRRR